MKPAIRNGLTAIIVVLLGAGITVAIVRHQRDDKTRVSVAPSPSTTTGTTVAPSAPTTLTPTTAVPATTAVPPTTPAPAPSSSVPGGSGGGATATSTAPPTTAPPGATTTPSVNPGAASPYTPFPTDEHPKTGGHPLSVLALLLIAVGLGGLRLGTRARSSSRQ